MLSGCLNISTNRVAISRDDFFPCFGEAGEVRSGACLRGRGHRFGNRCRMTFFLRARKDKIWNFSLLAFRFSDNVDLRGCKKEERIYSQADLCSGQDALVLYQGGFLCRFPESGPCTDVFCSPSFFGKDIPVHISYALYGVSNRHKGDCGNSGDGCLLMKIFLF